ncbi:alpha/beta fold hydrolase [Streptomyces lydicus]|uniref:alpha/beta fold hydrolase n=1 Tax=Streptomyces lydicus TaxID=47763 RepID=UPI001012A1AA|nr:alpha/beta hydrolase [Streptomyces lydicus]MCZ1006441.1 alpha/beta hydrolase [Streptomyces lydicus]
MADISFPEPRIGPEWARRRIGAFRDAAAFERFAAVYREAMDTLPRPDEQRTVDTAFGSVRVYRFGTGAGVPLVLMPGRQSCTPLWRTNLPGLMKSGRPVYAVDGLGEPGCSVQSAPMTSGADQAAWIDETLGQLGLARAHVLGVSIGGWLAVQVALHRPGRIASVIALDPASTFAPLSWKMIVVSLGSVLPGMPAGLRNRLLGWISGGIDNAADHIEGRLIASGMRDFKVSFPPPARPGDDELRALRVPVLALIAGKSIAHDPQKAASRARMLRAGTVEVWPEASHAISGEYPERIAERVEAFLREA